MLNGLHQYHLTLTAWAKTYGKMYRSVTVSMHSDCRLITEQGTS